MPAFRTINQHAIRSGEHFSSSILRFETADVESSYREEVEVLDPSNYLPHGKNISIDKDIVKSDMEENVHAFFPSAYLPKGEFDLAIADYTKAIELNPEGSGVYGNRGIVWLILQNWHNAREDIAAAKRIGLDVSTWFHKLYKSVENFERIIEAELTSL